jgi:hypothetical protein
LLDQHQVLLVLSNISTAYFNPQLKYLSFWRNYFWLHSQNSPSVCYAVCQLMKLCVQLVTSLCTLHKAVACELKFLPYEFDTRNVSFLKH